MRLESDFRRSLAERGLAPAAVEGAVEAVREFEAEAPGGDLDALTPADVDRSLAASVSRGGFEEDRVVAMARYCSLAGPADAAARLWAHLLPIGVLDAMGSRLAAMEGAALSERIMRETPTPVPGAPPESYPPATAAFVAAARRELGPARTAKALAWNVHGIPDSAFEGERERFLAAASIQAWLDDYHARKVAVLARHAADGTLWFEQRITDRVVDYVRARREILGGVASGDSIIVAKIPYDPDRYLGSNDPLERRRLACHCPLAASSIVEGGSAVPGLWCSCSAGFAKRLFDVAFEAETEASVLESVLEGSERCRFAVRIPDSVLAVKAAT